MSTFKPGLGSDDRILASAARRTVAVLLAGAALLAGQADASAAEWFVSVDGSAQGTGSYHFPWDINTAFQNNPLIKPGDTLYLRGGTYVHPDRSPGAMGYDLTLAGSPDAPIVIKPYNHERVTLDGGMSIIGRGGVKPQHLRISHLEVIVSENLTQPRTSTQSGSHPDDVNRPWGSINVNVGYDIKLFSNYLHHNQQGFGFWSSADNSEVHGNVVVDNGWQGPDRYHGHGIYTQNHIDNDVKRITDNLFLENFALPMSAWAESGPLHHFHIEGNTARPKSGSNHAYTIVGGNNASDPMSDNEIRGNYLYGTRLRLGYNGKGGDDIRVFDNTVIRNTIHYDPSLTNVQSGGNVTWQQGDAPLAPIVALRPNLYDPGRAHLTLIQPGSSASSISVDFGSLYNVGDAFELRDPMDLYGTPIYQGVYNGAPINVPVGGAEFSAFVVMPQYDIAPSQAPATPAGTFVAFEAESASLSLTDPTGEGWNVIDDPNAFGGKALQADASLASGTYNGIATFEVIFEEAGLYELLYRARTIDADGNSNLGNNDTVRFSRGDDENQVFAITHDRASNQVRQTGYQWDVARYANGALRYNVTEDDLGEALTFQMITHDAGVTVDMIMFSKLVGLTNSELDLVAYTATIPEPASALLLVGGSAALLLRRQSGRRNDACPAARE